MQRKGAISTAPAVPLLEGDLTERIIGAAIEVHRVLGPGLLESAYQACLAHECRERGLVFEEQVPIPIDTKGLHVDPGYRPDFVFEKRVIVEIKAVEAVLPIHEAQLLTYLKLTAHRVGLLINFNVPVLRKGIVRRVV